MDQAEFTLSRPVCLSLPIEEADKLLQEKDGRCALVYLALLRAGGLAVLATPRGYVLENPASAPAQAECRVVCRHDDDRLKEELYTVVDLGGAVIDVTVEHSVYGQITAPLHIFSRYDTDAFCRKLAHSNARPLCDLTGGIHLHTLRAPNRPARKGLPAR